MNIKFGSDKGESCIERSCIGVKCSLLFRTTVVYLYKIEEIYGIVSHQNFCVVCIILQHVSHKCMCHMYVTSGLLSGSSGPTSVANFNPGSNTHFDMRIYVYVCSYY